MNVSVEQLAAIVSSHEDHGKLCVEFIPDKNAWSVVFDVGDLRFVLSSKRNPVRLFKSMQTLTWFMYESFEGREFSVNF